MDPSIVRGLTDKIYEKRKAAALEVERLCRSADKPRIAAIISQLADLSVNQNSNTRCGGVMGLAGCSIALGPKIVYHLDAIAPPIISCFSDLDHRVRYYACESMYNVAKVAKGEILIYFNELFDALSKLCADTELPVKNGCELLDRLIKDIVIEQASTYVAVGAVLGNEKHYLEDEKVGKDKDKERDSKDKVKENREPTTATTEVPPQSATSTSTVTSTALLGDSTHQQHDADSQSIASAHSRSSNVEDTQHQHFQHTPTSTFTTTTATTAHTTTDGSTDTDDYSPQNATNPSSTASSSHLESSSGNHDHIDDEGREDSDNLAGDGNEDADNPNDSTTDHHHRHHHEHSIHDDTGSHNKHQQQQTPAFSLERFIPLLRERMDVLDRFTRNFLVSWLFVLHHVPELEIVSYLADFLDGLLRFLGDPNSDIRVATQNLLKEFLQEIQLVAEAPPHPTQQPKSDQTPRSSIAPLLHDTSDSSIPAAATLSNDEENGDQTPTIAHTTSTSSQPHSDATTVVPTNDDAASHHNAVTEEPEQAEYSIKDDLLYENEEYSNDVLVDSGLWTPGQGLTVDHAAIVFILLKHIDDDDEDIQGTCLHWLSSFIQFFPDAMVPLTPQIVSFALKHLAHKSLAIREAAIETNADLFNIIQSLPVEADTQALMQQQNYQQQQSQHQSNTSSPDISIANLASPPMTATSTSSAQSSGAPSMHEQQQQTMTLPFPPISRVSSQISSLDKLIIPSPSKVTTFKDKDPFDYSAILSALTHQFLAPSPETRVAALKWLQMLHMKAPRRVLPKIDDSLSLLLVTLSDPSEVVVKAVLRLLAQISSLSAENYFGEFMRKLCQLFSTDRRILEERGSLIIVTLCVSLNTERIFRAFAEIMEKDEDLEFASLMVQNLNVILITSPELSDFRKRLRNLESRDGQLLFTTLYRSWSHNAVSTFTLCLLAGAYEHASNLLQIFAELEVTVALLIQIDKLVQLLESPIFITLRLQLLEPERNPYLLKSLYGLLMLLPQSSAFVTLRNRLNAVSALGFLHTPGSRATSSVPATTTTTGGTSSTGGRRRAAPDEIRWNDLLAHFRSVQMKHEKSRKTAVLQASSFDDHLLVSGGSGNSGAGGAGAGGEPVGGITGSNATTPGTASPSYSSSFNTSGSSSATNTVTGRPTAAAFRHYPSAPSRSSSTAQPTAGTSSSLSRKKGPYQQYQHSAQQPSYSSFANSSSSNVNPTTSKTTNFASWSRNSRPVSPTPNGKYFNAAPASGPTLTLSNAALNTKKRVPTGTPLRK